MYINGTKCCLVLFCSFLSFSLLAKEAKTISPGQGLIKPLCFVENRGQLSDQDHKLRNDIQFNLSAPGMNLFVGNGQLHYQFKKVEGDPNSSATVNWQVMNVSLVGANRAAKAVTGDMNPYYENYYTDKSSVDGITVHSYNKITYKDVYPNIDWVLYVKNNQVEYDFVVRPGGDASRIKIQYSGANDLKIGNDGSLCAETPMGKIAEKKLYAYDGSGKTVAAKYLLKGNVLSFETGKYNGTLTIDPTLVWSTYFGTTGQDVATSVAVTTAGNTYVGGYTSSNALAVTLATAFRGTYGGGAFDAFLAEFDPTGLLMYCTYFGGTGDDRGTCVAVDHNSNVYLAGSTTSNAGTLPSPIPGAYHILNNGGTDGFLIKFSPAGARLWCTFYGGAGTDVISAIACDAADTVYIAGQTNSISLIASGGAYQTLSSGTSDAFLAKFNGISGANLWSSYYGGTGLENAQGIAVDASNCVYITGQTGSINAIASAGAYQTSLSGINDAYIAKFVSTGSGTTLTRLWGTYLGGTNTEQGTGIAYDRALQRIAVVGNTTSVTGVSTPQSHQPLYGGGTQDAFIAYFDTVGTNRWVSFYGGSVDDYGQSVCFDLNSNIVIAGGTFSPNAIATPNSFLPAIAGDYDAFVAKFNTLGQRIWGTYFGDVFYDFANSVACDGNGQITIAGHTTSLANIATAGVAQTTFAGGVYDAFVTEFARDTFVAVNQPFYDTLICNNGTLKISYTVYPLTDAFAPGNVFSVELSDNTGSFAAPTVIGTSTSSTSGIITCTVPPAAIAVPDTHYRIRITASDPAYISADDYYDIHIITGPLTPTTVTSNTPVCVGNNIFLHDIAPYTVTTYNWYGPDGFFSVVPNPIILGATLANAGTYSVTVVHNGCPTLPTSTGIVVVNDFRPPTPSDSASLACDGRTLYLFANADTTAADIIYRWTGPGGFTTTVQNPIIPSATFTNTGTYYVYDTVEGCLSFRDSVHVTVLSIAPVSVDVTVSPNDTVCGGTMVTFTATPHYGGTAPIYQWMVAPSSPIVGAVSDVFSSASLTDGEAIFCVMTSDVVCSSLPTVNSNVITMNVITNPPLVHIAPTPGLHVSAGSPVTFTATVYNGGVAPVYHWYLNHVLVPSAMSSIFTIASVTQEDTVTLNVVSSMMCAVPDSGISNTVIVTTNVGIANTQMGLDNIALYPNPNNGSFIVKGDITGISSKTMSMEITNMLGQVVYYYDGEAPIKNNMLEMDIDLGNVTPGIYLMHISENNQNKIFRFTVQR